MKRIDARTVEFTETESVIAAWHSRELDRGLSQGEAMRVIDAGLLEDNINIDPEFRAYLTA